MKVKKKYVRVKDRRQGLAVKDRKYSTVEKNGNQWTVTPKQMRFVELWLNPDSDSFGNAYQSALAAGFSTSVAKNITTNAWNLLWVKEARGRLTKFTPEHIVRKLEQKTNSKRDSDSIRALEVLARIQGMFVDRTISQVDVTFTNAVPRPVTHVEVPRTGDIVEGEVLPTKDNK